MRTFFLVLSALSVTACQPALVEKPVEKIVQVSPPVAPSPPQSPASDIRDYAWTIPEHVVTSKTALMMGRPQSGDILVTFWCVPSSGSVEMTTFNHGPEVTRLFLGSGGVSETIIATPLAPDDFYDEGQVRVNLDVTQPVLAAFRQSGELSKGDPPFALRKATTEELDIIERYFTICERANR